MCKIINVDKSSYYRWIREGSIVKKVDEQLSTLIDSIFIQGKSKYGTRRIQDNLKELYGLILSRKHISSIMKDFNLKVKIKRRYKITTDSNHNLPIAPNILNRDFYASAPDEKYVGWSMDDTMKVSLVNDTLNMAISHRKPPKGL